MILQHLLEMADEDLVEYLVDENRLEGNDPLAPLMVAEQFETLSFEQLGRLSRICSEVGRRLQEEASALDL